MEKEILQLTYKELIDLNHLVVERIKELREARNKIEIQQFNLGNTVEFLTDEGDLISGIVAKINKKTVGIVTEDGERWNVSPGFLKKVSGMLGTQLDQDMIEFSNEMEA